MSLTDIFYQTYKRFPQEAALSVNNTTYSYQELHELASCNSLKVRNSSSKLIGIYASRSIDAYAGLLGTLYAQKGYVPFNPKFPNARTAEMIQLSGISDIIVEKVYLDKLLDILATLKPKKFCLYLSDESSFTHYKDKHPNYQWVLTNKQPEAADFTPDPKQNENDPAYLLFTSGTTGKPKGVLIDHIKACAYITHISKYFISATKNRFSQFFDLTFDLSVHDLFLCWAQAGELCVLPESSTVAPAQFIIEKKITHWFSVPSLISLMKKLRQLEPNLFPSVVQSFFCGEALKASSAINWASAAPNSTIHNLYGPTEATIAFTHYKWTQSAPDQDIHNDIISIGTPLEKQEVGLFNEASRIINPNEQGELCLSGNQVIHEYFDPSHSQESFFTTEDGKHWYRTGDWAMLNDHHQILFTGRKDSQVKIRGHRVELQEIESVVQELTSSEAIALAHGQSQEEYDYTYVFVTDTADSKENDIINHCRAKLPGYMVPKKIFLIDKFPLNANGKISRAQLRETLSKLLDETSHAD